MDTTILVEAASQAGVLGPAMIDALARGASYFAAKEPTAEHLQAWVTELKTAAPHLFAPAATLTTPEAVAAHFGVPVESWQRMSPADRMTYARQGQPPVVRQKPGRFMATPEQLTQLEGKSPTERRTQAWLWQQEQERGAPMAKTIYDAAVGQALLVPSGTTITASTTYAGVRCSPTMLATSMWCLDVQAIAAAGTYTFVLEASQLLGGTYSALASLPWPSGQTTPQQTLVGIPASGARVLNVQHEFLRVRAILGGSPSVTFTSWIGKPGGGVGLGAKPGDILAAI